MRSACSRQSPGKSSSAAAITSLHGCRAILRRATSRIGRELGTTNGLPEPDRAVVEDPALAGIEGPPLRGMARDRGGCPARYRVLERAQAPLPVGPQTAPPHRAPPRGRHRAEYGNNLADAPL